IGIEMDKDLRVSIIIPVFNCEQYIEECLNSAINQSYKNIEIIVIDDGSTDGTLDVCNEIKNKHPEIVIKSQENKGVSDARNKGIEIASGDWICFLDADDYLPADYVKGLVDSIDNADLVCCKYCMFENTDDIKKEKELSDNKLFDREESLSELLLGKNILGTPWGKLFKKSIISDNNLRFDKELIVCEDLLFCVQYANTISKCIFTNQSKYYYRKNDSSFNAKMRKRWDDSYLQRIDVCNRIQELLGDSKSKRLGKSLKYQGYFSYARIYEYLCSSTEKNQKVEEKKAARRTIRKNNYIYIWFMFKTKSFKKENFIFFIKNILRGFGYQS
ncbi:MAG: glycosyltransferase family 2 protein, partial [Eubacterium sp.]|nr:glycosyltransferase family 2 protein [Eubacterium sp.]